jgi:hypothetical protein
MTITITLPAIIIAAAVVAGIGLYLWAMGVFE